MRLARRGTLVRCRHGYKSVARQGRVAAGTVKSLLARGWFVVSKSTPTGEPIEVDFVGKQTEIHFADVDEAATARAAAP
ncbi:MAG: hypothetical protein EPN36_03605 [Rhodanobacteraceae bacterium]|nr:MAG: hypothetical protein EPN36_03605 [Rhodanobacteraceae bacterium]